MREKTKVVDVENTYTLNKEEFNESRARARERESNTELERRREDVWRYESATVGRHGSAAGGGRSEAHRRPIRSHQSQGQGSGNISLRLYYFTQLRLCLFPVKIL